MERSGPSMNRRRRLSSSSMVNGTSQLSTQLAANVEHSGHPRTQRLILPRAGRVGQACWRGCLTVSARAHLQEESRARVLCCTCPRPWCLGTVRASCHDASRRHGRLPA
jgi:hypothetical protein